MARNDGIDRTVARNVNLTASKIANAQRHNEREKESYTNPDIVPERLSYNVHFKTPTGSYAEMFEQMKADGVISTRGLKEDAHLYGELVFDVNSAYCQKSGDEAFYLDRAAEVFVETARFWVSRYTYRPETGEADLLFCKGPDEYCGITNNNLFTNVMVQHNLDLAIQAAKDLKEHRPKLYARLGITQEEIDHMGVLRKAIKWPHDPVTGRLAQDETLHLLEPVDMSEVKLDAGASYHHVCFDRLQRYRVIKQADVLLLMTRIPHLFTGEEKKAAWEDFEPICLHDSTLSFASHALFALQNGYEEKGFAYLRKALMLDLRDVMGNTGHEGLHFACMGEAWQAAYTVSECCECDM